MSNGPYPFCGNSRKGFSLFGPHCLFDSFGAVLRDGDGRRGWTFHHDGPSLLFPGDSVLSLEVPLQKHCSLFFDASLDQRAMALSGTSHHFVASSAHSSL